jgi:osmotically-inducible protein OsmY
MRRLLLILALPLLLNGCVAAMVAGGTETGVSLAEDRSLGRKFDDNVIYTDITNQFVQADQAKLITHVTFNIRYGRVMLTGTVPNQGDAEKAVAITWKAKGVQEVINELVVNPNSSFFDTANDALIKRNLESRLLLTKNVWVINYSMDVQAGTAYLIGRVKDQAELDRVLNVARTTKGVKKVVSHLQINPDSQNATPAPASQPAYSGGGSTGSYGGATIVNTAPAYSPSSGGGTSGTVDAPGSVSSGDLPPPAKH